MPGALSKSKLHPSPQRTRLQSSVWEARILPRLIIPASLHGALWRSLDTRRSATKVQMEKCPEYDRLYGEVENVLGSPHKLPRSCLKCSVPRI